MENIEAVAQQLLGKTVQFKRYIPREELAEGVIVGYSGSFLTISSNEGWSLKENYGGKILVDLPQDTLLWHISIDEIIKFI